MKKLILISASILSLSACSLFGDHFKNTPPTDFKVAFNVGNSGEKGLIEVVDKDVYINSYQKDNFNNSYFAHFVDDSYAYYHKDVKNNGDWESYTPETANTKNMTTLDAINAFVGTVSGLYSDIFNVELINGHRSSGTEEVIGIDTDVYNVGSKTYWYYEGVNTFLKIYDESEEELSCSVTDYQYYKHFDDSPFLKN